MSPTLIVFAVVLGSAVAFGAVWLYLTKFVDPSRRKIVGLNVALFAMSLLAISMFMRIYALDQRVSQCESSMLQAFEDGVQAGKEAR